MKQIMRPKCTRENIKMDSREVANKRGMKAGGQTGRQSSRKGGRNGSREGERVCERVSERERERDRESGKYEELTSNIPLASTPALLLRNAIRASVGSSAVSSITALQRKIN